MYAAAEAIAYGRKKFKEAGCPDNPEDFARFLGTRIIVGSDNYATDGPPSVICRTPDQYAPRQRFTIFHEEGHILIQRGGFEDDILASVDEEDAEWYLELVVNHMAGTFLIPDPLIERLVKKHGRSPKIIPIIQVLARASFAAVSRRLVYSDFFPEYTIFLLCNSYLLDVASSNPYNQLRRYDRLPDVKAALPDAKLHHLPSAWSRTIGMITNESYD